MKNQFILFLFFANFLVSFGQKMYSFDYAIQYNFQLTDTSKVQAQLFLTNSKDNSYVLKVSEMDSVSFKLYFVDQNGIASTTYLNKKEFTSAESIIFDCKFVHRYRNPFKHQTDNYDFSRQNDTVINGSRCSSYSIKSNKPKKEKRKKFTTLHFIIENNTGFHLPILTHSTSFEEWKKERNIPNGIPKQFYMTKFQTNEKILNYTLVEYVKINKFLIIPAACDYTNPDVSAINFPIYFINDSNDSNHR